MENDLCEFNLKRKGDFCTCRWRCLSNLADRKRRKLGNGVNFLLCMMERQVEVGAKEGKARKYPLMSQEIEVGIGTKEGKVGKYPHFGQEKGDGSRRKRRKSGKVSAFWSGNRRWKSVQNEEKWESIRILVEK